MAKTKKPAKAAKKTAKAKPAKAAKKAAPKKTAPAKKVATKKITVKKEPAAKKTASAKPAPAPSKPAPPQLVNFPVLTQRPIAHKPAKSASKEDDRTRYSDTELKEFEVLINEKLDKARGE